ncbi:hypothetical protein F2Q69_00054255 [Brassica cretica]|uniref:Uncharacterized protein n=1 Tax=Brassica cretica TaxID=69181 RepID=A0A8S9MT35_BRACR|nr:hypothetical protein F2Q69_00054255 [Brassica cretica]
MSSSHGDKRSSDVEMGEATSPAPILTSPVEAPACVADHLSFRERLVCRQAEKEQVVTPRDAGTLAGSVIPDALALSAGSSTTPILVEDKERAADSMPPPPARKEIVLALCAPILFRLLSLRVGRGSLPRAGDSSIASGLRGKFMSLIDGMISECGSETRRQGVVGAAGDLGKTASSLLKEKNTRKAKSSEVRRLQRQIKGDAGLASRGIREAKDAHRSEFQARLAKISAFLGSLECIRNRDLALATIEGGMAVVQSFQSETPPTLEAEEARLSSCKGDLAVVDGDFDLILAGLKSACFLPTCSEGPEGKDLVLGEGRGDAAPSLDEATGEEGAYRLRGISEDVEYCWGQNRSRRNRCPKVLRKTESRSKLQKPRKRTAKTDRPASSAMTRSSSPGEHGRVAIRVTGELGRDTGQLARRARPRCRALNGLISCFGTGRMWL